MAVIRIYWIDAGREFDSRQVHVYESFIYTAGLIDGEGSILLSRHKPNEFRSPCVSLTSTTWEIVDFLKESYRGSISTQKKYREHHKESWIWKLTNKADVFYLLDGVWSYLREPSKRARAIYILNRYDEVTVRNGKYNAEAFLKKMDFEETFMLL